MIFVTIGTHPDSFERLIKRIDEIAPKIKEKIIIQRGFTKYIPKNCESFDFKDSLDDYYKNCRLLIVHGASSVWEFALKYHKPLIIFPRQKKYGEHINDHQVEFGEYFAKKTGTLCILDENKLTPGLLLKYKNIAKIKEDNLKKLRKFLKKEINAK